MLLNSTRWTFKFYVVPCIICEAPGQVFTKLQSCSENQLKTIHGKMSPIPPFSPGLSLSLPDYLASAFKMLIEPKALPRSAISGSFLLPVRENAREVQ